MARKKKTEAAITLADPTALAAQLLPERSEAEAVLAVVQKLDLSTQVNRDKAGLTVQAIRGKLQSLKELQKRFTMPIDAAKKAVTAEFKPVIEYWEACNVALSDALMAAHEAASAAQNKALARVAETAGNTSHDVLVIAHATPATPEGLQERVTWSFEVTDHGAVPERFWTVNETLIREAVRDGAREIPGVRIFEVKSFAKGRT